MKIVVIGGTGRVGASVVRRLAARGTIRGRVPRHRSGHDQWRGPPRGHGQRQCRGRRPNAPAWEDDAVREFFTTSTSNQLEAERAAGVGHHVAVTIVGADRVPDSGYLRAKIAQERVIEAGGVPYTILRATQFLEFLPQIVESGAEDVGVRLSTGLMQPVGAEDVAATVTELAIAAPARERLSSAARRP